VSHLSFRYFFPICRPSSRPFLPFFFFRQQGGLNSLSPCAMPGGFYLSFLLATVFDGLFVFSLFYKVCISLFSFGSRTSISISSPLLRPLLTIKGSSVLSPFRFSLISGPSLSYRGYIRFFSLSPPRPGFLLCPDATPNEGFFFS